MLSIRSNAASTSAQNNMSNVSNSLQKSMERLSSGFRINRAGDDAAGLAISEKLKAQVGGLMQAARNSGDGISMVQTAEGGMDEIQNMLQRMRELAVEASNDTLGTQERVNIGQELDALRNEADSVANRTKFNGLGLLSGSLTTKINGAGSTVLTGANALTTGAGSNAGQGTTISAIDVSGATGGSTFKFSGSGNNLTLTNTTTHQAYTIDMSTALSSAGATLNATDSATLDFKGVGVKVTLHAGTGAYSAANAITDLTQAGTSSILTATGSGAAQLQSGANQGDTTSITFADVRLNGGASSMQGVWDQVGNFLNSGNAVNYASQAGASTLITKLDTSLDFISTERAKLGAAQNRLEHSISSVKSQAANLEASNSRIRDVDVAEESGAMARANVLMQAGVSVLSQANQMPQLALKLLG
jgi:flagellin